MESAKRSILKAFSWRILALIQTFLVALLFTRSLEMAMTVGALDSFVKIFTYYLHERAWNKSQYGRPPTKDDFEI